MAYQARKKGSAGPSAARLAPWNARRSALVSAVSSRRQQATKLQLNRLASQKITTSLLANKNRYTSAIRYVVHQVLAKHTQQQILLQQLNNSGAEKRCGSYYVNGQRQGSCGAFDCTDFGSGTDYDGIPFAPGTTSTPKSGRSALPIYVQRNLILGECFPGIQSQSPETICHQFLSAYKSRMISSM